MPPSLAATSRFHPTSRLVEFITTQLIFNSAVMVQKHFIKQRSHIVGVADDRQERSISHEKANVRTPSRRIEERIAILLIATMAFTLASGWATPGTNHGTFEDKIHRGKHIVVIYQENWSFDSLYGDFPGANGIDNASADSLNQVDRLGTPYSSQLGANNFIRISSAAPQLSTPPLPINTNASPAAIDGRFPRQQLQPDLQHASALPSGTGSTWGQDG